MESNPVIQLFLALAIIIAAAKICGRASRALGQPRVFGELLAGVILGPTLLDFLRWPVFTDPHLGDSIAEFAELGVLLLMFNVGMDIQIGELVGAGRVGLLGGVMGALGPLILTFPMVLLFDFSSDVALFAGVALAATSVSISAQTLLELGLLQTKEGYALLAMALVDDVVAIVLISFAVAVTGASGESVQVTDLILIVVRMSAYIAGAGAVAWFVLPRILEYMAGHPETSQAFGRASFALIFALVFGWSAEYLGGVAAITGAFIAGAGISRVEPLLKERIRESTLSIAYVFLMPVFFVGVGLETDLKQIFTTDTGQFTLALLPFALVLLTIAVLAKVGGVYAGSRLGGFTSGEAFRVGICMISRGEVGLIIAAIGLNAGIFTPEIFPAIFLVILVSTVLTPPLVRLVFRASEESPQRETVGA